MLARTLFLPGDPLTSNYSLQLLVSRLRGCLSMLSPQARQLLVWRTGVGIADPLSDAQIAGKLGISIPDERQLVVAATVMLVTSVTNGSCPSAVALQTVLDVVGGVHEALAPLSGGPSSYDQSGFAGGTGKPEPRRPRQKVLAARAAPRAPGTRAFNLGGGAFSPPSRPNLSSVPWVFVLVVMAMAAFLLAPRPLLLAWLRRRDARPAVGVTRTATAPRKDSALKPPAGAVIPGRPGPFKGAGGPGADDKASHDPGGGPEQALAASHPADARGDATEAFHLGVMREQQGDLEGALAAYRRADDLGDAVGASAVGKLLAERGDLIAAVAAYGRADERGDAAAATALGRLLEQEGNRDGALAAYRRADKRGDASGAFNLACLLAERGDLSGALAAYRRADDRNGGDSAVDLGVVLEQEGDLDGALAVYRRAANRGDARAAFRLGALLARRGDAAGAESAARRTNEHE